jgi:hypothetical protein
MMRPWAKREEQFRRSSNRRQGCMVTCNELLVEVFWKTKGWNCAAGWPTTRGAAE